MSRLRMATDKVFAAVRALFEPILDEWQILKLCRFAVLTIVVVAFFLIWIPQGQEVLILLHDKGLFGNVLFLGAVIAWAWVVWYSSRIILSFQFVQWPPSPSQASPERLKRIWRLHRGTPRWLGASCFLVIAWALFRSTQEAKDHGVGLALSLLYVSCAAVFGFVVWNRREWAASLRRHSGVAQKLLAAPEPRDAEHGELYTTYHQLHRARWGWIWASVIGLSIIPFLLFQTLDINLALAPRIGSPVILVLAAASWVPVGTFLVYWSNHYRIPIFTVLLVYLVMVSAWNDNHAVRQIAVTPVESPPTLRQQFDDWLRVKMKTRTSDEPLPVVLVAAEGGGIRAAYWSASVLSRLQQDRSDFASHVFVISGVSGGSLGAGLFAALIADQDTSGPCAASKRFLDCTKEMLQQDFLASTFATMLYPDLVQRFLFWSVPQWDRARTLEMSWETTWASVTKLRSNHLTQPFENLWRAAGHFEVPSLVFNLTSVEHGNRVLLSNLQIDESERSDECLETLAGRARGPFDDVIDLHEALNARRCNYTLSTKPPVSLALSTAINNSARFAFVSPAGRVNEGLHIVDGGYFEDSGTVTLEELYHPIQRAIESWNRAVNNTTKVVLVVVYISNEPETIDVGGRFLGSFNVTIQGVPKRCARLVPHGMRNALLGYKSDCPSDPVNDHELVLEGDERVLANLQPGHYYMLHLDRSNTIIGIIDSRPARLEEVLTPFWTIFRARLAGGDHGIQHLIRQTGQATFIHVRLRTAHGNLPLGWTLSQASTREMDEQLKVRFQNCDPTRSLAHYLETCAR